MNNRERADEVPVRSARSRRKGLGFGGRLPGERWVVAQPGDLRLSRSLPESPGPFRQRPATSCTQAVRCFGRADALPGRRRALRHNETQHRGDRALTRPPGQSARPRLSVSHYGTINRLRTSSVTRSMKALTGITSCFFPAPRTRSARLSDSTSRCPSTAMYGTFCSSPSRIR
jgi:hypothetical protein